MYNNKYFNGSKTKEILDYFFNNKLNKESKYTRDNIDIESCNKLPKDSMKSVFYEINSFSVKFIENISYYNDYIAIISFRYYKDNKIWYIYQKKDTNYFIIHNNVEIFYLFKSKTDCFNFSINFINNLLSNDNDEPFRLELCKLKTHIQSLIIDEQLPKMNHMLKCKMKLFDNDKDDLEIIKDNIYDGLILTDGFDDITIKNCKYVNDYRYLVTIESYRFKNHTYNIIKEKDSIYYNLYNDKDFLFINLFKNKKDYYDNEIFLINDYFNCFDLLSDEDKKIYLSNNDLKESMDYLKLVLQEFKNEREQEEIKID